MENLKEWIKDEIETCEKLEQKAIGGRKDYLIGRLDECKYILDLIKTIEEVEVSEGEKLGQS